MVERRDQVLIGRLSFDARAVSTFCTRWWSTNGPFLMERAICPYLYLPWRLRTIMGRVRLLRRGFLTLLWGAPRGPRAPPAPGLPSPPPRGGGNWVFAPPPPRGGPPPPPPPPAPP